MTLALQAVRKGRAADEPEKQRNAMNNAEIARAFVEKGWEIRYRGGNSMCSTPSDLDMIVADAPSVGSAPRPPEPRPRYSVAAWPMSDGPNGEPRPPILDLYDAERGVEVRVHRIPTPKQAARLLECQGNGESSTGHRNRV